MFQAVRPYYRGFLSDLVTEHPFTESGVIQHIPYTVRWAWIDRNVPATCHDLANASIKVLCGVFVQHHRAEHERRTEEKKQKAKRTGGMRSRRGRR